MEESIRTMLLGSEGRDGIGEGFRCRLRRIIECALPHQPAEFLRPFPPDKFGHGLGKRGAFAFFTGQLHDLTQDFFGNIYADSHGLENSVDMRQCNN